MTTGAEEEKAKTKVLFYTSSRVCIPRGRKVRHLKEVFSKLTR